jgi:lysophospholipase L1-like esterase/fibronectin type 3 domain-containing protein
VFGFHVIRRRTAGLKTMMNSKPLKRRVVSNFARWVLVASSVVVATASPDDLTVVTPTRIMPLGDSITRGVGSTWGEGYRLPLVQGMVVGRYASDLVGVVENGPPWLFDRNHEGYSGAYIENITSVVANELNSYRPDYVLLMIGTNDVWNNYQLDTAPDRLSTLIDLITNTRPSASLVVASITPFQDPVLDSFARTYNDAIPPIVEAKAAAGKHVSFLDMYSALTVSDLKDGVHPNDAGYRKMAAAWTAKVAALRPSPPPVSTRSCPCSMWAPSDAPVTAEVSSTTAAEVGVKFRTEQNGFITAVRFYKGSANLGPHQGHLWKAISDSSTYNSSSSTMSGTLLASGTVTSGGSSGWQEVVFATPVPVQAHTVYFASYYAPFGRYAADPGYFRDREIVHSPLRLPSQGSIAGNGFIRTGSSGLPSGGNAAWDTNYWVDVVFVPAAPGGPAGVTATAVSTSRIDVSWDPVANATGYRIERSSNAADWSTLGSVAGNVTSYSDTGLAPATTYYYRVFALANGIESPPSGTASATTQNVSPPAAPASVTATAISSTQINVAWSSVAEATGYRVERSTDGTSWAPVATTSDSVTAYNDTGLQAASTYSYRVVATNAGGDSSPSGVATATTQPPPATQPAAPASLVATAVSSTRIDLAWSDVAGETGYRIERSIGGASWTAVGTTAANVTAYGDTGLASATTYSYRVVATSGAGDSPPSPVASAMTSADTISPTAPTSLKAASAKAKVNLSWTGSTDGGGSGLTGYRIWRSTNGASGSFTVVGTIGVTSYTDANVVGNLDYWYRVTAYDRGGNESQPSNVVAARPK